MSAQESTYSPRKSIIISARSTNARYHWMAVSLDFPIQPLDRHWIGTGSKKALDYTFVFFSWNRLDALNDIIQRSAEFQN